MLSPRSPIERSSSERHLALTKGVGVGFGLAALLTLPKVLIEGLGEPVPFLMYVAPIAVASYIGGIWAGCLTTVAATMFGALLFVSTSLPVSIRVLQLGLFCVQGCTLAFLCHRILERLRQNQAELSVLRDAQAMLERVLSGAGEGITLRDGRGTLLYANEVAARLTGFDATEQLLTVGDAEFERRFDLFQVNGQPFPRERLPSRLALLSGETREDVIGFRLAATPESSVRWVRVRANPTAKQNGNVSAVVTLFRDITEVRHQEEALVLAHEWFQSALRSIADAVITTDNVGTVNMVNPAAEALLQVPASDAVGSDVASLFRAISETTRQELENPVSRVLREGTTSGLPNDSLLLAPDGRELAVENTAAPIYDRDGELRGVILVLRDVSEKRARDRQQEFLARATVELSSSLDYRRTLGTVARVAVPLIADWCAVDILEEGEVRRLAVAHVDPEKVRVLEEIQRQFPPDPDATSGVRNILRTGRPEMIPLVSKQLTESVAQNEQHRELIRLLGLNSYLAVPMLREGKPFGVITLAYAESKRRYTEADLALAQALADRAAVSVEHARLMAAAEEARAAAVLADRTKSDFLAMLGHELRNPLAPIQTALELWRADSRIASGNEYKIIQRQVKHVVRLVDDLLDMSRITNGKVELSRENVNLLEVIDRAREMITLGGALKGQRLELCVDAELAVHGDPTRLAQIFTNLLMNACKYTPPPGKIWIEAFARDQRVVVRFRDEGIGIDENMLPVVFESFTQEPQALDRARGGLGLGLSIVQGLVAAHGGRVSAQSDGLGKGALFEVELPRSEVKTQTTEVRMDSTTASRALNILVVDDNVDAAEMLGLLLERRGHHVRTASSGAEAIDLASHEAPNVALLDVGLPDMSGYELGRRLRALQGLGHLAIAAITGYGQGEDEQKSRDAGFVAHLVKPVDIDEIGQLLSSLNSCGPQATGSHIQ